MEMEWEQRQYEIIKPKELKKYQGERNSQQEEMF